MALGAQIVDVLRGVLLEGMRPTVIGILVGIAGSLLLGRILKTMIYGVQPTDLSTFATVVAMVAVVSLLACVAPAYRATQVELLRVIHDE
jgi:putative ABC transport system permease protein